MRCFFRCSAMKFLVITGAVFVVINIAFFCSQLGQNLATDAVRSCDCTAERKSGMRKTVEVKQEVKQVKPAFSEEVKPAFKEEVKPAFNEEVKPAFNEEIKPAYNDKVKPKVYNNALNSKLIPVTQGSFFNQPYQPLKLNSSSHKLAVVVPFRNRYEEMMEFVPHMHSFLTRQNVSHHIWVVNQVDMHRFNRAALLNIGFLLSRRECDHMVMHDIDLLPLNDDLPYKFPSDGPFHVSSPELHPLYHYKSFVGGILIMSRDQFQTVNGLSNLFWGWGREDDELYVRMQEAQMKVHYPQGIRTGYNTFKHNHDKEKRPRDQKRYKNQGSLSRKRDRQTGLSTIKFKVVSNIEMTISKAPLNFVSVELVCDYDLTPYCDNPS